jgi:hypothetical protein
MSTSVRSTGLATLVILLLVVTNAYAEDPLPSWSDGPAKSAIREFVSNVTREGGPHYVPPPERIATFDNDGTLWSEQPVYFQVAFVFYRTKTMAPEHPEWNTLQPYKSVLEDDMKALAASGEKGMLELMMATHAGITTEEFNAAVSDWVENIPVSTARTQGWCSSR